MSLDKIITKTWKEKKLVNTANYCNRRTHPRSFPYRKYKRGKQRCNVCGAKIGTIWAEKKSLTDDLTDNIFRPNGLLSLLKGAVPLNVKRSEE